MFSRVGRVDGAGNGVFAAFSSAAGAPFSCVQIGTNGGTAGGSHGARMSAVATASPPHRATEITIAISGALDMLTDDVLMGHVDHALSQLPQRLTLDLHGVTFLGSAGLHALLAIRGQAHTQGTALVLRGAHRRTVLRPLITTGLLELFVLEPPSTR